MGVLADGEFCDDGGEEGFAGEAATVDGEGDDDTADDGGDGGADVALFVEDAPDALCVVCENFAGIGALLHEYFDAAGDDGGVFAGELGEVEFELGGFGGDEGGGGAGGGGRW